MVHILLLLFSFFLRVLAAQNVPNRRDTLDATGDSQCTVALCIGVIVNGSTAEYIIQSTGTYSLGWMGMGFGDTMAHSPMVIMWPNSDGTITLSQRETSAEVMPTVVGAPPRVAAVSNSLSSISDTKPKLAYTIPANSDTIQNVIWAFGSLPPSSSAVDAILQQHVVSGTLVLDLTKPLGSDTGDETSPAESGSSSSSRHSNYVPFSPYQKLIVAHATLCGLGFLVFLPIGALQARYLRTFTPRWFRVHWIVQFAITGPIIVAGVACAIRGVVEAGSPHLNDVHKRWGVAIFTLYFAQCSLGAFIHWVKPKARTSRPPQNYLHAIFGLLIISLALYQVRSGYSHEWPHQIGRGAVPNVVNILWYIWVVSLPVLYIAGLSLLPRQFAQERRSKTVNRPGEADMVNAPQDGSHG